MKTSDVLKILKAKLAAVSSEAETEAKFLIAHFLGLSPSFIAFSDEEISGDALDLIEKAAERRLSGEPLQYVLGEWSFMGLDFTVTPDALIPRQDTETLVETAIGLIKERGYGSLLDICTGTGCIAVSLFRLTGIRTEASDISPACAALAGKNAEKNGAEVTVRTADLFDGAGRYDIITANPPYITDKDMDSLQKEVRFEPELALRGGKDGLDVIRRIADRAGDHVNPGGALLIEVGYGEAESAAALFPGRKTRIIKDLNGIDRIVEIDF